MSEFSQTNSKLIAIVNERTEKYVETFIDKKRGSTIVSSEIDTSSLPGFISKHNGKVRDVYVCDNLVIIVSTDRQSAFDRALASVPYKGQVLNLVSNWWFEQTKNIVPNHILANPPHPSITIARKCFVFPVEFIMRGYISGTTSTSMWTNYAKGVRKYCGHILPDSLTKNMKLFSNLLTPTTKDDVHDELTSAEEIVSTGRMTLEDWTLCASYAHSIFDFSQKLSLEKGLILVDTKYEFGKDELGNIFLIDEIQTPDSSRYWIAESYESRMASGEEPENIDKEFLRRWYIQNCDPYQDEVLPQAPASLINELSRRYIMLYETITGQEFPFDEEAAATCKSEQAVIAEALQKYFAALPTAGK